MFGREFYLVLIGCIVFSANVVWSQCGITADAGPDQRLCAPPETGNQGKVQLDGTATTFSEDIPSVQYRWYLDRPNGTLVGSVAKVLINKPKEGHVYYLIVSATTDDCETVSDTDNVRIQIIYPSFYTRAWAGNNQNICRGDTVILDAGQSTCSAQAQIKFQWYQDKIDARFPLSFEQQVKVGPRITAKYYLIAQCGSGDCSNPDTHSVEIRVDAVSVEPEAGYDKTINYGEEACLSAVSSKCSDFRLPTKTQWRAGFPTGPIVSDSLSFCIKPNLTTTYYMDVECRCYATGKDSVTVTVNNNRFSARVTTDSWTTPNGKVANVALPNIYYAIVSDYDTLLTAYADGYGQIISEGSTKYNYILHLPLMSSSIKVVDAGGFEFKYLYPLVVNKLTKAQINKNLNAANLYYHLHRISSLLQVKDQTKVQLGLNAPIADVYWHDGIKIYNSGSEAISDYPATAIHAFIAKFGSTQWNVNLHTEWNESASIIYGIADYAAAVFTDTTKLPLNPRNSIYGIYGGAESFNYPADRGANIVTNALWKTRARIGNVLDTMVLDIVRGTKINSFDAPMERSLVSALAGMRGRQFHDEICTGFAEAGIGPYVIAYDTLAAPTNLHASYKNNGADLTLTWNAINNREYVIYRVNQYQSYKGCTYIGTASQGSLTIENAPAANETYIVAQTVSGREGPFAKVAVSSPLLGIINLPLPQVTVISPFADGIKLLFSSSVGQSVSVELYDVKGRRVYENILEVNDINALIIKDIASGVYFLKTSNDTKSKLNKLVAVR